MDLKPLNEGVLRETDPIPPVDDKLAQIAGATGRCQLRLLANPAGKRLTAVDNLHHPTWMLLLRETPIWHIQCTRAIPAQNVPDPVGDRECSLSH